MKCLFLFLIFPAGILSFHIIPLSLDTSLRRVPTVTRAYGTQGDDIPSMDWLTHSNGENNDENMGNDQHFGDSSGDQRYIESYRQDEGLGSSPIPSGGVSMEEEMMAMRKVTLHSTLDPIDEGLQDGVRVAHIVTTASSGNIEPARYILGLSKVPSDTTAPVDYALIDIPPFSYDLCDSLLDYMGPNGRLATILITSRDSIHYDDPDGEVSISTSDMDKWSAAFPDASIVMGRIDIPRDCQDFVTQRLHGDGPFAWDDSSPSATPFVQTGKPWIEVDWGGEENDNKINIRPPKEVIEEVTKKLAKDRHHKYTPEAIREREEGKRILAICTPGRTPGSMSYIFPDVGICAPGYSIPFEQGQSDSKVGVEPRAPRMDHLGFVTTSKAGLATQLEYAATLVNNYIDRFHAVLPSSGNPVLLIGDEENRKETLLRIVNRYKKLGSIYSRLGITR